MKFSSLLAVGQSFRRATPEGRYRVEELQALPRFETAERPGFSSVAPVAAAPAPVPAPVRPANLPVAAPVPRQATLAPVLRAQLPEVPWWRRWFARRAERRMPSPVQTELRLDAVRVVRNDLSDSELEIVAAPVPALAEESPFASPAVAPTPEQPLLAVAPAVPVPAAEPGRGWRRWLRRQG
jgi:hypothetical protein